MKIKLKDLDTFVYIDVSIIRNALKISDIEIDWNMLYDYLKSTYKNLKSVKYFEGIDRYDNAKKEELEKLKTYGYKIKSLERKSYNEPPKYRTFVCKNCHHKNKVNISKKYKKLKSNVDVYLCSELMGDLLTSQKHVHAIILSCDGDYAEMIRNIIKKNSNVYISVFATPFTKSNNYLSIRLKKLERIDRYYLVNILNIKDRIRKL